VSTEHQSEMDPVRYSADQLDEDTHNALEGLSGFSPRRITPPPTLDMNVDPTPSPPPQSQDDLFSETPTCGVSVNGGDPDEASCGVCRSAAGEVNQLPVKRVSGFLSTSYLIQMIACASANCAKWVSPSQPNGTSKPAITLGLIPSSTRPAL
jgi:hypothetical protein